MAKNNKQIIVSVGANTAEFNKAMKGLNTNMASMQKQLAGMGSAIAAAFSVGAIVAFGKAAFDAMQEQERANKKLSVAVGGNAYAYDELSKQAEKLRAATGIDDGAIMNIQQMGVSLGLTTEDVKKLTEASVQLSVKTGMDLDSAYRTLAKSLTGVGKGLKVLGPEFAVLTKEQLMNGDAIDLVSKKYGTFAEDTVLLSEKLTSNFGELKEAIGYAFNEGGFSPALRFLNLMIQKATNLVEIWGKFGGNQENWATSGIGSKFNDDIFKNWKKGTDKRVEDKSINIPIEIAVRQKIVNDLIAENKKLNDDWKKQLEVYKNNDTAVSQSLITQKNEENIKRELSISLIKKEIGYLQELQDIASGKKGKSLTPGVTGPTKAKIADKAADSESLFNFKNTEELVLRTNKIKKNGLEIFAKFNKEKNDEARKDAMTYFDNVTNANVDYYNTRKRNDTDYYLSLHEKEFEAMVKLREFGKAQAEMMSSFVSSTIGDVIQGLADLLTGNTSFDEFFSSIFSKLGDFLKQMGAAILAYGIAFTAMSNPLTAIPAGIALIAAGAVISSLVKKSQKMAFGGVVPDGYPNDTYPALLTSGETVVPAKRLPDFGSQQVEVFGVLRAGDIYISNQRGAYLKGRKG